MVLRGGPRGRVGRRRTCLKRVAPDVVERPSSLVWPVSVIQSRLASTGRLSSCERPGSVIQDRLASTGRLSSCERPGSVIQDRLASTGLSGSCERPTRSYGENPRESLDNASTAGAQ